MVRQSICICKDSSHGLDRADSVCCNIHPSAMVANTAITLVPVEQIQ